MDLIDDPAEQIAVLARSAGHTIASAESLTGGMLTVRLAAASEAATWFRGGLVAYDSEVKRTVLGVPGGPVVSEHAATAMATGVARLLGAGLAVSTTGVGGPGEEEGQPPGTVWIALSRDGRAAGAWEYRFDGEPSEVCRQACDAALHRMAELLRGNSAP